MSAYKYFLTYRYFFRISKEHIFQSLSFKTYKLIKYRGYQRSPWSKDWSCLTLKNSCREVLIINTSKGKDLYSGLKKSMSTNRGNSNDELYKHNNEDEFPTLPCRPVLLHLSRRIPHTGNTRPSRMCVIKE